MGEGSGGILKRLFKGKADETAAQQPVLASRMLLPPMDPGPTLTLSFNHERGVTAPAMTAADHALEEVLGCLARTGVRATFHCPARLAESAADQMGLIRDAGHEIACHGYLKESAADLAGSGLPRILEHCREAFAEIGVRPHGFHPPAAIDNPRRLGELASDGYAYLSELSREDDPRPLVAEPKLFVRMPIAANDSGYVRHPDNPRHVFEKHAALIDRLVRRKHFMALNYHTWILAEGRSRIEDLSNLILLALRSGVKIVPFVEALPPALRPAAAPPPTDEPEEPEQPH